MSTDKQSTTLNTKEHPAGAIFTCPNCGVISQDDVIFLCNNCRQDDLIFKNDMYMCPACLMPGKNFECMLCGSKEVTMTMPGKPVTDTCPEC